MPTNSIGLPEEAGVNHGVVQDKLWVPGIIKLKRLKESGFFGRILSVRGEFGYWVFEGEDRALQRPSWNYRKKDGGSIILDMFPHWRYVLDSLFGKVKAVSCLGTTHIKQRWDEQGTTVRLYCRRFGLLDFPTRRRHHCPLQLVLGGPCQAGRSAQHPGRRHAWVGGLRPA